MLDHTVLYYLELTKPGLHARRRPTPGPHWACPDRSVTSFDVENCPFVGWRSISMGYRAGEQYLSDSLMRLSWRMAPIAESNLWLRAKVMRKR